MPPNPNNASRPDMGFGVVTLLGCCSAGVLCVLSLMLQHGKPLLGRSDLLAGVIELGGGVGQPLLRRRGRLLGVRKLLLLRLQLLLGVGPLLDQGVQLRALAGKLRLGLAG